MKKIIRKLSFGPTILAIAFMIIQVFADLYLPTLTSDIINKGVAKGNINYIWQTGFLMVGFSLFGIIASLGNTYFAIKESQKLGRNLRSEIFKKVESLSVSAFDQFGTASLITRTTNDVTQVQMVVQVFLCLMINAPIMLIGASLMAYNKDPQLTKIFFIVLPLMGGLVGTILYFAVPLFKTVQRKMDRLNLVFREGLTGVRVIRSFVRTDYEEQRFKEANRGYTETAIKVNTLISIMIPLMTIIMSITSILIMWFGAHYVAQQKLEVGNLIAFMTYAMQSLMSFIMLAMIFIMVPRAQASAERINEILEAEDVVLDSKNLEKFPDNQGQVSLIFDHVNYCYKGAEDSALTDISFSLVSGNRMAVIGGTGSGKTTLVSLALRFYDSTSGEICINGQNIGSVAQEELRQRISFVPQKSVLFSGTIRENMQYGYPKASDEEIWKALRVAQADSFVSELTNGLDTWVEQGGNNFSGGQKQRLAIARALIKPADIYIFDDSFSALDFKTDAKLRAALKMELVKAVVIIVAQRVSTVMDASEILVLDEGKIVGKGKHEELYRSNETYREIVQSQLGEGEAM
ncbi:ABC transporter ATP-binding protein [Enterococcus sp. LJL128]|uniref:ABC transporter ATP-binding protein n=1 Tax=Enterococcus sp. LJL51 TaxID=3416656 RepID=UPI003CFA06A2